MLCSFEEHNCQPAPGHLGRISFYTSLVVHHEGIPARPFRSLLRSGVRLGAWSAPCSHLCRSQGGGFHDPAYLSCPCLWNYAHRSDLNDRKQVMENLKSWLALFIVTPGVPTKGAPVEIPRVHADTGMDKGRDLAVKHTKCLQPFTHLLPKPC